MAVVLKKLGVVDLTTLDTIQVPNIMAGVGDATSFGITKEDEDLTIEDAQEVNHRSKFSLGIRGIAQDQNLAFLQAIKNSNRSVNFAGLNVDTFFQWVIPTKMEWVDKLDSKLHTWKIGSAIEVGTGYDSETGIMNGGIHVGYNILGLHKWGDEDGDGVPNGMSLSGGLVSSSFNSNGELTINLDATSNNFTLSKNILFPFPNTSLTVAMDRISSDCNLTLRVRCFDSAGIELNQVGSVFRSSNQTQYERISATGTTPADTHRVQFQIEATYTGATSTSTKFRYPSLRLDRKTEYSPI